MAVALATCLLAYLQLVMGDFKKILMPYNQLTVSLPLLVVSPLPGSGSGRIACMGSGLTQTVDATIPKSASRPSKGLLGRAVLLFNRKNSPLISN